MSPRVVLVGLPGSGKTSVGRGVAKRLGVAFADADQLIERRAGRSVPEIFAAEGEPAFRQLEEQVVADALATHDGVLALGGGAVLSQLTRQRLSVFAVPVVFLDTDVAAALSRTHHGRGRPLLADDPAGRLAVLAAERAPLYAAVATATVTSGLRPLPMVIRDVVTALTPADAP